MRTTDHIFKRFILPTAIVGLVVVVARLIVMANTESPQETKANNQDALAAAASTVPENLHPPYSETAKEEQYASLHASLGKLEALLAEGTPRPLSESPEAKQALELARVSIEQLRSASQSNWEQRRDAAYADLEALANLARKANVRQAKPSGT